MTRRKRLPERPLHSLLLSLAACGPGTPEPGLAAPTDLSIRQNETIASVATVSWTQPAAADGWVEWQLDGEEAQTTPVRAREAGEAEQILLGIPFASTFRWRVVLADGDEEVASEAQSFSTGDPPADMPQPTLLSSDPSRYDRTDPYLLGSVNACGWNGTCAQFWTFLLDRQGRLVWALATPDQHWTLYAQPAQDGAALLVDEATWWSDFDFGGGSQVHRLTLDGNIEASYPTIGLHHSFLQLPDGSLVWGQQTQLDEKLKQRDPDGTVRTLWSCQDMLQALGNTSNCASNSLWYDEPRDRFLFSFYTVNSIAEIDHASGETLRVWGELGGAFDPTESQFLWQHGPSWTPEGTLLVSSKRDLGEGEFETVAYEYDVDDDTDTLTETWSAGKGEGVFGETDGEAHRLPNGNTLHNLGSAGRLREWTPEGARVWEVDFGDGKLLGHTLFVHDLYALSP